MVAGRAVYGGWPGCSPLAFLEVSSCINYDMLFPPALLAAHFDRNLNLGLDLFQQ
jgi:hypothetical protein